MALTGVFPHLGERVPEGRLRLVSCPCGLLQLDRTFPPDLLYGSTYGYRSGLNASMVSSLYRTYQNLVEKVPLTEGDAVLDIGCSDGTFLGFFPPFIAKYGVDPLVAKFLKHIPPTVQATTGFFKAADFSGARFKLVTAMAMFYDLDDPLEFLEEVKSVLADDGYLYVEQLDAEAMLRNTGYDSICHEHLTYFTWKRMVELAKDVGLYLVSRDMRHTNGGSHGLLFGRKKVGWTLSGGEIFKHQLEGFSALVHQHRLKLWGQIQQAKKPLAGLGASTKGNVILQWCRLSQDEVPVVLDVNKDKYQRHTPGTFIPIRSEADWIDKYKTLLVLPWHFRYFFELKFQGREVELLFPLKEVRG